MGDASSEAPSGVVERDPTDPRRLSLPELGLPPNYTREDLIKALVGVLFGLNESLRYLRADAQAKRSGVESNKADIDELRLDLDALRREVDALKAKP